MTLTGSVEERFESHTHKIPVHTNTITNTHMSQVTVLWNTNMCIDEYLYMKYTQYRKLKEMTRHRLLRNDEWGGWHEEGHIKITLKNNLNLRLFHFGFLFCSPKYWLWPVQSPHLQGELIDGFFALDMVLLGEQVWEYVVPLDTRWVNLTFEEPGIWQDSEPSDRLVVEVRLGCYKMADGAMLTPCSEYLTTAFWRLHCTILSFIYICGFSTQY